MRVPIYDLIFPCQPAIKCHSKYYVKFDTWLLGARVYCLDRFEGDCVEAILPCNHIKKITSHNLHSHHDGKAVSGWKISTCR